MRSHYGGCVLLGIVLFTASSASANDRKFVYTYETSVLPFGAREFEIWNTFRTNRGYYYRAIDQRMEFEIGMGSNVMTAFYLNHTWLVRDANGPLPGGDAVTDNSVSISNEWKFKLADRVADPVGIGLYTEATLGLDGFELEGKLLLDKQIEKWLIAFNASAESERTSTLESGEVHTEKEFTAEFDLGIAREISNNVSIGLEFRNLNEIVDGTWEHSALFGGPVVSYSSDTWWATLTVLPQLTSFKGGTSGNLVLDGHEKLETRLVFSFHL